jgi:hypothetical protein
MRKLELNKDGAVHMSEFELLCKHYPEILKPLLQSRKVLRKKIIFPRFWKELTKKRFEIFDSKTILEIRGQDDVDYAQICMDYLNLQLDSVPYKFIEQWKTTQRKKQHSYQGNIELPYELWDKVKDTQSESNASSVRPSDESASIY